MDFIEQWLGIAPDNGSGMLELVIFASLAALGIAVWSKRRAIGRNYWNK
jgi:hypothetical protein